MILSSHLSSRVTIARVTLSLYNLYRYLFNLAPVNKLNNKFYWIVTIPPEKNQVNYILTQTRIEKNPKIVRTFTFQNVLIIESIQNLCKLPENVRPTTAKELLNVKKFLEALESMNALRGQQCEAS